MFDRCHATVEHRHRSARHAAAKAYGLGAGVGLYGHEIFHVAVDPVGHRPGQQPDTYKAALIDELVGETGEVTTVDIDPDVVDRARSCLAAAG